VNPVERSGDGVRIRLHIQPRAAGTGLAGVFGDALKVRLKSPPVDGAANEELIRFLAEKLGVPRNRVELVAGHSARRKTVRVEGVSADDAARLLGLARD
jgi:uncharacterized protein (TIGR00251 family)